MEIVEGANDRAVLVRVDTISKSSWDSLTSGTKDMLETLRATKSPAQGLNEPIK